MKKENLNFFTTTSKFPSKWFYLNTASNSGFFNMSCDSYLLNKLISREIQCPILRLYAWSESTVSLGVNQSIDKDFVSNFPLVKRITGGQAVYHGARDDELTYSIFLNWGLGVKKLYFEIGQVLISFLSKYGLKADFGYADKNYKKVFNCFYSRTSADIVINDVKVIGSAQCRRKIFVLQHGSIKLDKLRELSKKDIYFSKAALDLKNTFETKLKIKFIDYTLTTEDCERINFQGELVQIV